MLFYQRLTRHHDIWSKFFPRHRRFASCVIKNFLIINFQSTPIRAHSPPHPPLLVAKFTPSRLAVILHPCWRSNSPLATQRSFSTPAGGQPHPSSPRGHLPPLLLEVNFTLPPARFKRKVIIKKGGDYEVSK